MQQLNNSFILICLQFLFLLSALPRSLFSLLFVPRCGSLGAAVWLSLPLPLFPHIRVHCAMFKKFEINCCACLLLLRLLLLCVSRSPLLPFCVLFSAVS